MLQHILRTNTFVFILLSLFFSSHSAVAEISVASKTELAKQFSQAKKLAESGQTTQAISAYQSIIQLNPLLPEAYNNLAALYLKQKNTKQAKNILEQGLYAHKGYGILYESLTAINVAMAREAYSKALQIELKPSDVTIAAVSLSEAKAKEKNNSIVISKADKPVAVNAVTQKQTAISKQITVAATLLKEKPPETDKVKNTEDSKKLTGLTAKTLNNTEAIETVLQAWSAAWSAQAVDIYLSFYHQNYRPSNGLSRKGWVQSRRLRIKKPGWIKVGLSDFKIKKNSGNQAVVNFKQSYQSDKFRDVSSKQMVLLHTDDGWRIFREKSL